MNGKMINFKEKSTSVYSFALLTMQEKKWNVLPEILHYVS